MIITARLKAIPVMEIRMMGPDREFLLSLLKVRRLAINRPVLKLYEYVCFKDINYCPTFNKINRFIPIRLIVDLKVVTAIPAFYLAGTTKDDGLILKFKLRIGK
jgi:hypothetical protein